MTLKLVGTRKKCTAILHDLDTRSGLNKILEELTEKARQSVDTNSFIAKKNR